jgi:hypothetical protein
VESPLDSNEWFYFRHLLLAVRLFLSENLEVPERPKDH